MLAVAFTAVSCNKKAASDKKITIKEEGVEFEVSENLRDSASYALGLSLGLNGLFSSMDEFNVEEFSKGMADGIAVGLPDNDNPYIQDSVWAQKFKVSPYEINVIVNRYVTERAEAFEKAYMAKVESDNEGVQSTESGLRYVLHNEGEGDFVDMKDTVVVNYKGTLTDGTEFDANESVEFITNQMIPGFTEGLTKMKKGAKATFYIPSKLGYGPRPPYGSKIKPNSILVFEVELLEVKKAAVAVDSVAVVEVADAAL